MNVHPWNRAMQSPIPPPTHWHRCPSSCPEEKLRGLPWGGNVAPSPSPWKTTHLWVHPSAATKSPLSPGQSIPSAGKHHGPEPSVAAAGQAGAERVPASPYLQLWIRDR